MEKIGNYVMSDIMMYLPMTWTYPGTNYSVKDGILTIHKDGLNYSFEGDGIIRISDAYDHSKGYDTHSYYALTRPRHEVLGYLRKKFLTEYPV